MVAINMKNQDTVWNKAHSIVNDVAVQVGALINGVAADTREAALPEPIKSWTIRFSWPDTVDAANNYGLMRIVMSPIEGLVKISASPLGSMDKMLTFERAISVWELDSQKLGQMLMDGHAWLIKKLTPGLCPTATCEPPAEIEDSVWSRIRSLAMPQPAELSVQL